MTNRISKTFVIMDARYQLPDEESTVLAAFETAQEGSVLLEVFQDKKERLIAGKP